jgi:hypothetical protein
MFGLFPAVPSPVSFRFGVGLFSATLQSWTFGFLGELGDQVRSTLNKYWVITRQIGIESRPVTVKYFTGR